MLIYYDSISCQASVGVQKTVFCHSLVFSYFTEIEVVPKDRPVPGQYLKESHV